jgi:hypothetical protein
MSETQDLDQQKREALILDKTEQLNALHTEVERYLAGGGHKGDAEWSRLKSSARKLRYEINGLVAE